MVSAAVEHIGEQHGIVEGRDLDAVPAEHQTIVFQVLADLQHPGMLEQGLEHGERFFQRNLLGRRRRSFQIQAAIAGRAAVAERYVASLARRDRQRHAHQIRLQGIERRGLRVHGHGALLEGGFYPRLEDTELLHQFIAVAARR
jgi:hypothetical protein